MISIEAVKQQQKQWLLSIDRQCKEANKHFGALQPQALNLSPGPKAWSIGQVLEHLILSINSFEPLCQNAMKGTLKLPWYARFGWIVNFMGNLILKGVQPTNQRKAKTFAIWRPAENTVSSHVVDQFMQAQDGLKKLILSTTDLLAREQVIHSPAAPAILYTLNTAFDIIVAHTDRHLQQALRVKEGLK